MNKLLHTAYICACLFLARMFGRYLHSGWDGTINYHRYEWRGREWMIPAGPVDE